MNFKRVPKNTIQNEIPKSSSIEYKNTVEKGHKYTKNDYKERLKSPVPKDLKKGISTEPINLKNAKNEVLDSQKEDEEEKKKLSMKNIFEEIGSFNNFKEDIEKHEKVEGTTRFADLATKNITKIDSNRIVKSPSN